jgi:hypothetical protein
MVFDQFSLQNILVRFFEIFVNRVRFSKNFVNRVRCPNNCLNAWNQLESSIFLLNIIGYVELKIMD